MSFSTLHTKFHNKWVKAPIPCIGDKVKRTGNTSHYSQVKKGHIYEVIDVSVDATSFTAYNEESDNYELVYNLKIKVKDTYYGSIGQWYSLKQFELLEKKEPTMSTLQIESKRPALVKEFTETVKDGDTVREYVKDAQGNEVVHTFESMSAARTFTSNEIINSIRKNNVYRRFAIFVEQSVAQAKEPQIEFK